MTTNCISELYFLPPIAFFKQIQGFEQLSFEHESYFVKQTYRNRCNILGANGVQTLIIPINKSKKKQFYKDVKINYEENWISKNNTALKSAYANSPFFDDYSPYFLKIWNKKHSFLYDLNMEMIDLIFNILQFDIKINQTSSFEETYINFTDYREIKTNKKKKPQDWLQKDNKSYQQVFGKVFVENLSIIDLIFCEGPMATNYLV